MEELKHFLSDTAQFDFAVSFNCNNEIFLLYGIKCSWLFNFMKKFLKISHEGKNYTFD